jgi:hypothetical protein
MTAYPCENRSAPRPLPVFVRRSIAKNAEEYVRARFGSIAERQTNRAHVPAQAPKNPEEQLLLLFYHKQ